MAKDVSAWRQQIIVVVAVAESLACLTRRNLSIASTVWASTTTSDPGSVHLDDEQVGQLATVAALSYAVSKPLQSLVSDSVSSRRQLSCSLVGAGMCNIAIGLSSSYSTFLCLMAFNGLLQGGIFPSIARLILVWYPESTRGSYWSLVSMSSNVGYGALPVAVTLATQAYSSWRVAFLIPGVVTAAFGILVPSLLRDSPRHAGLPDSSTQEARPLLDTTLPQSTTGDDAEKSLLTSETSRRNCKARLRSVCLGRAALSLWLVSCSIGCLFFVFRGLATWGVVWLVEARGLTPVQATSAYSLVEVGGVIGAAACGPLSDRCLDRAVMSAVALGSLACLLTFWLPAAHSSSLGLVLGLVGFAITVPKVSLPLLARSDLLPLSMMGTTGMYRSLRLIFIGLHFRLTTPNRRRGSC